MRFPSAVASVLAIPALAAAAGAATLKVPSDAFPTIQSAVDAAQPGDTVLVGPGEYGEAVVVAGRTDLRIRGRGRPVVRPSGAGAGFSITGCERVQVAGFVVDGGDDGVYLADTSASSLVRMRLVASVGSGIETSTCDGVLLSRCEISGGAEGITDASSAGLRIERCTVEGTTGDGMRLSTGAGENSGSNGAVITRNRVSSGGAAIRFAGEDAEISRNLLDGYGEYGIEVVAGTSSDRTVLSRNRLSGGGGAVGIKVTADQVTVSRNVLEGGAIYFDGVLHVAEGNRVSNAIWGVYMGGGDGTIAGNRMTACSAFGIRANGAATVITGNTLSGTNGNGIEIGAGGDTVSGNRVSGALGNGFDVVGTGSTLSGNRASGSGGKDLRDHNAPGANTYADNDFGTVDISADVIV